MIAASTTIIFNPGRTAPKPRPNLPTIAAEVLRQVYREFDDLPPRVSLQGIDALTIAALGYKICRSGYSKHSLAIPRGAIVVPVLSPSGAIVALHDGEGRWFTTPKVHTRNLIRARWTGVLEIFPATLTADQAAIELNVATIGLNGFEFRQLSASLVGESSTKTHGNRWRLVA